MPRKKKSKTKLKRKKKIESDLEKKDKRSFGLEFGEEQSESRQRREAGGDDQRAVTGEERWRERGSRGERGHRFFF